MASGDMALLESVATLEGTKTRTNTPTSPQSTTRSFQDNQSTLPVGPSAVSLQSGQPCPSRQGRQSVTPPRNLVHGYAQQDSAASVNDYSGNTLLNPTGLEVETVQNGEFMVNGSEIPPLPSNTWTTGSLNPSALNDLNSLPLPSTGVLDPNPNSDRGDLCVSPNRAGDELDQNIPEVDSFFSFSLNDGVWESNFSALDSVMGQYFPPLIPRPPGGGGFISQPGTERLPFSANFGHNTSEPGDIRGSTYDSPSDRSIREENLEGWALGNCTAASSSEIALPNLISNVAQPDDGIQEPDSWSAAVEKYRDQSFQPHERFTNVALTDEAREWLLIAVHTSLLYNTGSRGLKSSIFHRDLAFGTGSRFTGAFPLLPPSVFLQKYLDIFLTTFEPFCPMIPALSLNPNKLITHESNTGATLLLFLMIAAGAMLDPAPKARQFSLTLSEICRHTLHELMESKIRSIFLFQSGLIFTVQSAFSGRKSQMEAGTWQRDTFIAVRFVCLFFGFVYCRLDRMTT